MNNKDADSKIIIKNELNIHDNPLYSICMCNYNMADTLDQSLKSLLTQIDERFEVIVVDDGSVDNSVFILKKLAYEYPALRVVELPRDKKRKLGFTRNISIKQAKGKYVLLHLDCDDVFGPYLKDFINIFHRLENCIGRDVLVSGQHINMALRSFLMEHGPYLNMYRGEDRHLWSRLAKIDSYIPLDHIDFITRIPKPIKVRFLKMIRDQNDHMRNDFRSGITFGRYLVYEIQKATERSWKYQIFRFLMLFPAWLLSRFDEPISQVGTIGSPEKFACYREKTRGTYRELMQRYGGDPDLSFLCLEAKNIFSRRNEIKLPNKEVIQLNKDYQAIDSILLPLRPSLKRYFDLFWKKRDLSVLRSMQYEALEKINWRGNILDIGGGDNAHYKKIIFDNNTISCYDSLNINKDMNPSHIVDLSKPFQFPDKKYDMVFSINTFEHLRKPDVILRRLPEVLVQGGILLIIVPFLIRVHASPHDYVRLTASWWIETLTECGFENIIVEPLVWDPIVSASELVGGIGPLRLLRRLVTPLYGLLRFGFNNNRSERYEKKIGEKISDYALSYKIEAICSVKPSIFVSDEIFTKSV